MTRSQKTDQPEGASANAVSADELAEWIACSSRLVRGLADRGIAVRTGRGQYLLRESIAGYIAHLREVAAGRGAAEGSKGLELAAERARLAAAQADWQEMRNHQHLGKVVLVSDAVEILGRSCAHLRTRLMALPGEMALRVSGRKNPAEIREVLMDAICEALTELTSADAMVAAAVPLAHEDAKRR